MDIRTQAAALRRLPADKLPMGFAVSDVYLRDVHKLRAGSPEDAVTYVRDLVGDGLDVFYSPNSQAVMVSRHG